MGAVVSAAPVASVRDFRLVELRVLDGPNLYFPPCRGQADPRPLGARSTLPEAAARRFAQADRARATPGPGGPGRGSGSGSRSARSAGWSGRSPRRPGRPARRAGPPDQRRAPVVVAFPWRTADRAQALGQAVAEVLDALLGADVDELVSDAARPGARRRAADPRRTTLRPKVPVVAVTGTNGKTTTSRMIAHIARDGRAARRLVEHRRHLRRRRAGRGRRLLGSDRRRPGAGPPARSSSRSPRPRAAASCSRASA